MMANVARIYYRAGYKYQTTRDFSHQTEIHGFEGGSRFLSIQKDGLIWIKEGYAWDGPSGPTFDTKDAMRGSLVHDALYQMMREKILPLSMRDRADALLKSICEEDGMGAIRSNIWWLGVRKFADKAAQVGKSEEVAP